MSTAKSTNKVAQRWTQQFRLSSAREWSIIIILVLVVVLSWSFMTSKQTKRNILTAEKKLLLLLIGLSQYLQSVAYRVFLIG